MASNRPAASRKQAISKSPSGCGGDTQNRQNASAGAGYARRDQPLRGGIVEAASRETAALRFSLQGVSKWRNQQRSAIAGTSNRDWEERSRAAEHRCTVPGVL